MEDNIKGERIAKRLSRAGLCSRREAERLIADGRVTVDGIKISTPATLVTDQTVITVDGKRVIEPEQSRLWRYHKPRGLLSTNSDPKKRPTVFDHLPQSLPRVMLVGRLDLNSEGLLLLTNDGTLARKLELPATGWVRRYRVRAYGPLDEARLETLAEGLTIDGVKYGSIQAQLDKRQGDNSWLTVSLQEGKNREIRRVMEHLGLQVNRLIRIAYGPFQLGELDRDTVREVPARVLTEQTGAEAPNKRRLRSKRPSINKKTAETGRGKTRPNRTKYADRRR
ncbi:MAG: pseudouridine synthase [Rhodospirillaceae bacterium]|nr:pseudouridine synthase [Rhodospirillaceae bacterium]|tara:strand:- start:70424 stop:71266 length:843 start_codon:yes stop_codon:yes gene_type:complete